MKRDKLRVMVCLPCDEMPPNDRFIVVKATDGEKSQFIKFGGIRQLKRFGQKLRSFTWTERMTRDVEK